MYKGRTKASPSCFVSATIIAYRHDLFIVANEFLRRSGVSIPLSCEFCNDATDNFLGSVEGSVVWKPLSTRPRNVGRQWFQYHLQIALSHAGVDALNDVDILFKLRHILTPFRAVGSGRAGRINMRARIIFVKRNRF